MLLYENLDARKPLEGRALQILGPTAQGGNQQ